MKERTTTIVCFCTIASLTLTTVLTTTGSSWPETLPCLQTIVAAAAVMVFFMQAVGGKSMHLTPADMAMAAWWVYAALRTYADRDSYTAGNEFVEYTTLTTVYALVRIIPKPSSRMLSTENMMTLLLLAATAYELSLGVWQIYSGTSHHRLFPATGSMFNPGPYSAYVATGMAAAVSILHDACDDNWRQPKRAAMLWLCTAVVMGGCFIIAVTQSRSAMIAVAAATAWIFRREWKRKYAIPAITVTVVAAAGLFFLKMGSAMGRLVIWRQAADIIADSPLFGSGLGSFAGEYGRHLAIFFADSSHHADTYAQYADVADYAFCDILQVFAEQGVTGGILCATFAAASLRSLSRTSRHLFVAMGTLLAFSMFSYPMQILPLQTVAVCIAACGQTGGKVLPASRLASTATAAVCLAATLCCRSVTRQHVEGRAEYASIKGMTHSTFINDYYRLLPTCGDDKHFLFDFARLLQSNGRHLDACAILRQGTQVSGDPMFWTLMGNSQKAMHQYHQAACCYERAFAILPNRLYPLYRKMLLFRETGDTGKAHETAQHLLELQPKVESAATKKMKEETRQWLRENGVY